MNFRQKLTPYFLLYIVLGSAAFTQVVDIPDINLRAAIAEALNTPAILLEKPRIIGAAAH